MLPSWWIDILPKSDQSEINNTLNEIRRRATEYAKSREAKY